MRFRRPISSSAVPLVAVLALLTGCGGDTTSAGPTTAGPTSPTAPAPAPTTPPPAPAKEPAPADLPGIDTADAELIAGYLAWTELSTPPIASLRDLGSAHPGTRRVWASPGSTTSGFPYPRGTVVVKEGRTGDSVTLIAIMEKVRTNDASTGGWRYAEYTRPSADAAFGRVAFPESSCAGCHANANTTQKTDWVFYSP